MNLLGGADRDRTDDLLNAIQALSQLSYGPTFGGNECEESGVRVRNSVGKVKPCKGRVSSEQARRARAHYTLLAPDHLFGMASGSLRNLDAPHHLSPFSAFHR